MIDGRDVIMHSVLGEQFTGWASLLTTVELHFNGFLCNKYSFRYVMPITL